jgi:hypothetical protein
MWYSLVMRTTLDIEDDVLVAAKELARSERKTAGRVLSELARAGLRNKNGPLKEQAVEDGEYEFLGFRPVRGTGVITNEHVNRIREELGI